MLKLKNFLSAVLILLLIHAGVYAAVPTAQSASGPQSSSGYYPASDSAPYGAKTGTSGRAATQGRQNEPSNFGNNYYDSQPGDFNSDLETERQELFQERETDTPFNDNNVQDYEKPLTESEINDYFDEILESGNAAGNTIGRLFQRLPRYGISFFRNPPSTYAPYNAAPVAQDYRINAGDEMTLSMWGIPEEETYNFVVRRDGTVRLPRLGTIRLAGYTFAEAERILDRNLQKYYTGYKMSLSMGRLSSIMVYVTGNARRPGAYMISSFSTLVNALLVSGGPNSNGTLRKIELKRGGKTIAVFDMYAMLMKGDKTQDVRLQTGDVINIPQVGDLIGVAGVIQQPGVYELNGTTRVHDLLYTAGGLNARTFTGRIQYYKIVNHTYASAVEGTIAEFEDILLHDGDILRLYPVFNFTSTVLISGALFNPGTYAIVPGETKIAEILKRSGGLSSTSSKKAILTRITPSNEGPVHKRFTIDLEKAMNGDAEHNKTLEANDRINVMIIPEWQGHVQVTIAGEVKCPGTYDMFPGEKISDLIERAEGFTSKAFLRGAIFTRRSIAEQQRSSLASMADQLEIDLLQAMQNTQQGTAAEVQRRRELINRLRNIDIMGRIVTVIDVPKNIRGTEWDYELQNGDRLIIPERPLTVSVLGAVYSSSSHTYRSKMSINGYINASGGAIKAAHKRMLYLVKCDGTVIKLTRTTAMLTSKQWKAPPGFTANIEPGDTIVVPVKYADRQGFENLRDTIDLMYKIAITAGVILKI